jgi:hypothetical protein
MQRLGTGEAYVARLDRADERRVRRVAVVPSWQRLPEGAVPSPPIPTDPRPERLAAGVASRRPR